MWRREWPTFGGWEAVATVSAGVGTGVLYLLEPPSDPRWEGGILFDDSIRRHGRLESANARKQVRAWGDLPYYAAPVLPLLVDPLLVAWLVRDDSKAAFNLEFTALEGFAYAGLLSFISTRLSVRERPDSTECRRTHTDDSDCEIDTEAFWSGHTSIASASAGLVCANHRYLALWGHPVADAGACVLATSGAVWTGVSRILADRHYTTDVVAGFAVGFGVGYAVPTLLHYTQRRGDVTLAFKPGGACLGGCLELRGSF
ncbi:MAG TPA: phosphatase PAP2 family protein [Polyangiaceae bacterium]|nr:phosphatase PAP2 family protein [Polyangiaceae bacterium]